MFALTISMYRRFRRNELALVVDLAEQPSQARSRDRPRVMCFGWKLTSNSVQRSQKRSCEQPAFAAQAAIERRAGKRRLHGDLDFEQP